jgi:hypothetical protein
LFIQILSRSLEFLESNLAGEKSKKRRKHEGMSGKKKEFNKNKDIENRLRRK